MTITVHGSPAPQGSKRHVGRGIMVESSKAVKPWREAVRWSAVEAIRQQFPESAIAYRGPVAVDITFFLPRPKSAKKGAVPDKRPDIDKLLRSTFDALKSAGVYEDDSRVVCVAARKVYGNPDANLNSGAVIEVTPLDGEA